MIKIESKNKITKCMFKRQAKPELIIEDTPDRCLSDTEDNDHQEPLTIQSIDAIFDNLQKRSLKFRFCLS